MGWLSNLLDPGKKDRQRAGAAAGAAQFDSLNAFGPMGLSAMFSSNNGNPRSSYGLGQFQPMATNLLGMAQGGLNISGAGLDPRLLGLGNQAINAIGMNAPSSIGNQWFTGGLGQMFQQAMGTANADPFDLGQQTTDLLRQRAVRSNQNAVSNEFSRLFASGGLSNQAVREQVTNQMSENLDQQDLGFQIAGLEQGRMLQGDAVNRMMGAFGALESNAARRFGEQISSSELLRQNALSRFGVGMDLQNALLGQMGFGANLATSLLGASTGLTQLPIAFQNAALNAQGVKSNADLGAAGVHATNAANARSPLLEGINAIGSFMGGGIDLSSIFGRIGMGNQAGMTSALGGSMPFYNQYGSTAGFGSYNPFQKPQGY
jgi:hypothetical protein